MTRKSETDLSRYDLTRGKRITALLGALAKSVGQAKKKRRAA